MLFRYITKGFLIRWIVTSLVYSYQFFWDLFVYSQIPSTSCEIWVTCRQNINNRKKELILEIILVASIFRCLLWVNVLCSLLLLSLILRHSISEVLCPFYRGNWSIKRSCLRCCFAGKRPYDMGNLQTWHCAGWSTCYQILQCYSDANQHSKTKNDHWFKIMKYDIFLFVTL